MIRSGLAVATSHCTRRPGLSTTSDLPSGMNAMSWTYSWRKRTVPRRLSAPAGSGSPYRSDRGWSLGLAVSCAHTGDAMRRKTSIALHRDTDRSQQNGRTDLRLSTLRSSLRGEVRTVILQIILPPGYHGES